MGGLWDLVRVQGYSTSGGTQQDACSSGSKFVFVCDEGHLEWRVIHSNSNFICRRWKEYSQCISGDWHFFTAFSDNIGCCHSGDQVRICGLWQSVWFTPVRHSKINRNLKSGLQPVQIVVHCQPGWVSAFLFPSSLHLCWHYLAAIPQLPLFSEGNIGGSLSGLQP